MFQQEYKEVIFVIKSNYINSLNYLQTKLQTFTFFFVKVIKSEMFNKLVIPYFVIS